MPRLVITRKIGEKVNIGPDVSVQIVDIERGRVRLAIVAPAEVAIFREEIDPRNRDDGPPPSYGARPGG